MRLRLVFAIAVLLSASALGSAAERAIIDRVGRLSSMIFDGDELAVRGRLEIPASDWSRIATPVTARRTGDTGDWQGTITMDPGKTARFRQTVSEEDGRRWRAIRTARPRA